PRWRSRSTASITVIERVGNALGTLAFTWATVVLLGGYPTLNAKLASTSMIHGHLICAACLDLHFFFCRLYIYFRMFSRNNKLDYRLFFHTRGALRPLGWNGLVIIVFLSDILNYLVVMIRKRFLPVPLGLNYLIIVSMLILTAAISKLLSSRAWKLVLAKTPLHRAASLCVPLVAVLLASLLTISRLRFQRITKLVDRALGSKRVFWRRLMLDMCMVAALVMTATVHDHRYYRNFVISYQLSAVVVVSFGNLQIPAAATRVVVSLQRLIRHEYGDGDPNNPANTNLAPSLNIFYVMVFGQGVLYLIACTLEIFSFIPRRSLIRRGGFRGQWAIESIDFYYRYALEKCMERDVLAPKKTSLISYTMDSLNSGSPKMQLHGIRIMHSLLQREPTRTRLLSKLTTSTKTMATLINMLDWSTLEDTTIRLSVAVITAEVAKSLRVVTIPGTIQVVSVLLDYGNQQKIGNPLLSAIDSQEEKQDAVLETGNYLSLLENQGHSTSQKIIISEQNSWAFRCWKRIQEFWSVPQEEPLTEQDLLPALGMSILHNLAGLIVIRTTVRKSSNTTYSDTQRKVLVKSSLKVLYRLISVEGDVVKKLRHNVFLLRNLAEILGDSMSKNLALDVNARQAIGRIKVIITRLMTTFLTPDGPSSTDADWLLRKVSGQALAMLAMDSVNNCLVMLSDTRHVFMKELAAMIHIDRYRCVAASLLWSMCLHARPELKESDLKELSYILREVLERIMVVDGVELDILIGLRSQICRAIPEDFSREIEDGLTKDRFAKRLVDVLNASIEPSTCCPGIRRVILELAINMMEYGSRYTSCFNDHSMSEAVSMVEETVLDAENYKSFSSVNCVCVYWW
uniref:BLE2 protein n=1 Tax=Setaria italica TaxID=4555 RepID=K3ZZ49_SETIT